MDLLIVGSVATDSIETPHGKIKITGKVSWHDNGLISECNLVRPKVINTPSGVMSFRLPANVDKVLECLKRESKVPKRLKIKEQASRVAWRILKDWIEAQMAIIEADCAELTQVFLPYAQNDQGVTVYEQIKSGGFLKLTAPKE